MYSLIRNGLVYYAAPRLSLRPAASSYKLVDYALLRRIAFSVKDPNNLISQIASLKVDLCF